MNKILVISKWIIVGIVLASLIGTGSLISTQLRSKASYNGDSWKGRIGVRQGISGGEFYYVNTGEKFVPRGNNYVILAKSMDPWNGCQGYHATFNIKQNNGCDEHNYTPKQTDMDLEEMRSLGYNTVRVFINERLIGKKEGGLDIEYIKNVADFLKKAKSKNIYTMVTMPFLPIQGGYMSKNQNPDQMKQINWNYLSKEALEGKKKYVADFITGLKSIDAPMDAIFSYNIENEIYAKENLVPYSLKTGYVTTANGKRYNMSNQDVAERMFSENVVYFINSVRAEIKKKDPQALVAPGFFPPTAIDGSKDDRIVFTKKNHG